MLGQKVSGCDMLGIVLNAETGSIQGLPGQCKTLKVLLDSVASIAWT